MRPAAKRKRAEDVTGLEDVPPPALLVALDPGITGTGYCVLGLAGSRNPVTEAASLLSFGKRIIKYGEIRTRRGDGISERIRQIIGGLQELELLSCMIVQQDSLMAGDSTEGILWVVEYPAIAGTYRRNEEGGEADEKMGRGMQGAFDKLHDVTGALVGYLHSQRVRLRLVRASGMRKEIKQTIARRILAETYRHRGPEGGEPSPAGNTLDACYLAHSAVTREVWTVPSL